MAEQLGFDEVLGDGRAIHLHEPLAPPWTQAVNRTRDELLADTALALQQHRRVRRSRLPDGLVHFSERRAVAHNLVLRVDFLAQRAIRGLGAVSGELLLDAFEQDRLGKRLLDETGCPLVACLKSILCCAVSRHHDYGHCRVRRLDALENFEAVHARHFDVEKHEVWRVALNQREPFLAGGCADELITLVFECPPHRIADTRFVINDQNPGFHRKGYGASTRIARIARCSVRGM
jgi:hypothetical protein